MVADVKRLPGAVAGGLDPCDLTPHVVKACVEEDNSMKVVMRREGRPPNNWTARYPRLK